MDGWIRRRRGLHCPLSCVRREHDSNTVVSATGLTQDDWGQFFRRGAAIPVFVGGMLFSKCGIYLAERRRISFLPALLYFFEALLLGFFVLLGSWPKPGRSEEHTSELQSQFHLVCRLLLEKKKIII